MQDEVSSTLKQVSSAMNEGKVATLEEQVTPDEEKVAAIEEFVMPNKEKCMPLEEKVSLNEGQSGLYKF